MTYYASITWFVSFATTNLVSLHNSSNLL